MGYAETPRPKPSGKMEIANSYEDPRKQDGRHMLSLLLLSACSCLCGGKVNVVSSTYDDQSTREKENKLTSKFQISGVNKNNPMTFTEFG